MQKKNYIMLSFPFQWEITSLVKSYNFWFFKAMNVDFPNYEYDSMGRMVFEQTSAA